MRDAYSFEECIMTLKHSRLGVLTITGTGIGSVAVNMSSDRTVMDVAADGVVMTSKIRDRRGAFAVQIQQVSEANEKLLRWYNDLESAPAKDWDKITIVLTAPNTGEVYTGTRCAFQKLPDRANGAQGQMNTWNLLAADLQQDPA